MAIFNPTNVFPAPGTPVTKQMIFECSDLAFSMISEMTEVVLVKFMAPASHLVILSTEWFWYNAIAASTIVGVGE